MIVNDALLFIQSRLSDLKSEKWHENELLDCINVAYMELSIKLRLFIQIEKYTVEEENKDCFFQLPSNFIDKVKLKYNEKITVPFYRYESVIDKENLGLSNSYASILSNSIMIHGKKGLFELIYYCYFILINKKDVLLTPDICFNALCFYSIYLALQKKPHTQAYNEMALYKQLYEEELKKCKFFIYASKEAPSVNTYYVKC